MSTADRTAEPARLVKSVDALRYGVEQTTQRNRSLPAPPPDRAIPPRVGVGQAV